MRSWAKKLALTTLIVAAAAGAADTRPVLLTAERVWTGEGAPHMGWAGSVYRRP